MSVGRSLVLQRQRFFLPNARRSARLGSMPTTVEPMTVPKPKIIPRERPAAAREPDYLVICWNDPVNLMPYVTHVFQTVFGWARARAEKHMKEVHEQGKSVLIRESFERAEYFVHQLQAYGLTATLEKDVG